MVNYFTYFHRLPRPPHLKSSRVSAIFSERFTETCISVYLMNSSRKHGARKSDLSEQIHNNNVRPFIKLLTYHAINNTNIRHAGRDTTAATQGSTIYRRVKPAKLLPHRRTAIESTAPA